MESKLMIPSFLPENKFISFQTDANMVSEQVFNYQLSEDRYRALARNVPNLVVFMFDLNLRYLLVEGSNESLGRAGYSKQALEGKTLWEIMPPEKADKLARIYKATLVGEDSIVEQSFGDRIFKIHSFPARDQAGHIYAGVILAMDITADRQVETNLQASKNNFRKLYLKAKRQAQELALLHRFRNVLSQPINLTELLILVVDEIYRELGYGRVSIFLKERNRLRLIHQIGTENQAADSLSSCCDAINDRALKSRKTVFVKETKTEGGVINEEAVFSQICIPFLDHGEVVGTLIVKSTPVKVLAAHDLNLLKELGEYVSLAIHREALHSKIKENEERLQTVIRNAPIILHSFDLLGVFTLSEGKGLEALGLTPGELVGKSVFEVFQTTLSIYDAFECVLAGKSYTTFIEERGVTYEAYFSPVKDGKGTVISVIGVFTDITEKRRVERALQVERDFAVQVMRNIGQGLSVFKPDFTIEYANPAFAKMGGFEIEELIGKTPFDLMPNTTYPVLKDIPWENFYTQGSTYETELVRKDGSYFPAQIISEPIYRDGTLTGIVAVVSDLTEQKKVEKQLRLSLEKEKELGEMKSRLITTASHEFRTPLSAIISSTELLEFYGYRWSEEKKKEILNRISKSADKLTNLVEDILVYNRAEDGKLDCVRQKIDLSNYCRDLTERFKQTAFENKTVSFQEIGSKPEAYLDEKLLGLILNNLLSNALKYSLPGGAVNLSLEWQQENVVFTVKDQGIGIPYRDQAHLFEPFQRAENVGSVSGTGFGLAIVKQSVAAHGGEITFESLEGSGTTFIVKLPLQELSVKEKLSSDEFFNLKSLPIKEGLPVENSIFWVLVQAMDASSSGIIITDANQKDNPIMYANKGFEKLTGFLKEEVIGKNCRFLQGEDTTQPGLVELRQALKDERECHVVLRNYRKDGSFFWNELKITPLRSQSGKLLYFVGIQNNVSDRIRAERALDQSEKEFKALVENSPDLLARFDRNNRILYTNPSFEKISAGLLLPNMVKGQTFAELGFADDVLAGFEEKLRWVFETKEATTLEVIPNVPGEEKRNFMVDLVPEFSSDGKEVVSVLCVARDLTNFKQQ